MLVGHDWRRAIAPREGYYLRCRRCWTHRPVDEAVQISDSHRWAATPADRSAA